MGRIKNETLGQSIKDKLIKDKQENEQLEAARLEAFKKQQQEEQRFTVDREGKKILKEEQQRQNAANKFDSLREQGQENFVDLQAAIQKIIIAAIELNKVLYGSNSTGLLRLFPLLDSLKIVGKKITDPIVNRASQAYANFTGADEPQLTYSATVDEDGRLITNLSANGQPLTDEQEKTFNTALLAWAKDYAGFEVDNGVIRKDGVPVDAQTFEQAILDPEKGMHNYLKEELEINNLEQQGSTPSVR